MSSYANRHNDLPITLDQNAGRLRLKKGTDDEGNPVISWDVVEDCDPETCLVADICTYAKGKGRCKSALHWIKTFHHMLRKAVPNMSAEQAYMAGTLLIPAWLDLHRQYVCQAAQPVNRTYFVNQHGGYKMHPVHEEVRRARMHIIMLTKELGLQVKDLSPPGNPIGKGPRFEGGEFRYRGDIPKSELVNPNRKV